LGFYVDYRLKEAYRTLFRSKLGLNEAIAKVKAEYGGHSEIDRFLDFIGAAKRGQDERFDLPAVGLGAERPVG
jgi:acyl-[acyl carrier protein]--UDP-N-acetylglucosamine O-acyltransferase